jgi:hypothetical protein
MRRRRALPFLAIATVAACGEPTSPKYSGLRPAAPAPQLDAAPSETECVGLLTATFQNVTVPPGATCFLVRSRVTGNVVALAGSSLTTSENDIAGNIEAKGATFVNLVFDVVGGNVTIAEGVGDPAAEMDFRIARLTLSQGNVHVIKNTGNITLRFNTLLKGNFMVEDNVATVFLAVTNNEVAQNIQLFKNTGPGSKIVRANTAGSSIQCWENAPPFFADLNAAPKLEGQCGVPTTTE